jgi:hypothetical protein
MAAQLMPSVWTRTLTHSSLESSKILKGDGSVVLVVRIKITLKLLGETEKTKKT